MRFGVYFEIILKIKWVPKFFLKNGVVWGVWVYIFGSVSVLKNSPNINIFLHKNNYIATRLLFRGVRTKFRVNFLKTML